jgi:hypothetical protein
MKRRQHYIKGRRFENEARKLLEEAGWMVMRSAGSKGMFDLAAFGGLGTRLIQVKGSQASAAEREQLAVVAASMPDSIRVELWERNGPKRFTMTSFSHVRLRPRKAEQDAKR